MAHRSFGRLAHHPSRAFARRARCGALAGAKGGLMARVVGWLLFLGGIGHIATGYVVFREQLSAIFRDGVVNAVLPHFDRRAAFWFILFGVMVSMSGPIVLLPTGYSCAGHSRPTSCPVRGVAGGWSCPRDDRGPGRNPSHLDAPRAVDGWRGAGAGSGAAGGRGLAGVAPRPRSDLRPIPQRAGPTAPASGARSPATHP